MFLEVVQVGVCVMKVHQVGVIAIAARVAVAMVAVASVAMAVVAIVVRVYVAIAVMVGVAIVVMVDVAVVAMVVAVSLVTAVAVALVTVVSRVAFVVVTDVDGNGLLLQLTRMVDEVVGEGFCEACGWWLVARCGLVAWVVEVVGGGEMGGEVGDG